VHDKSSTNAGSNATFPLSPALSLGERETPSPVAFDLGRHTKVVNSGALDQAPVAELCRALFNINAFVYVD
jgi:hypothetical protein